MKQIFLAAAIMMISLSTHAQSSYDVVTDKDNGSVMYVGACTFADLNKEKSFSWLKKGEEAYKPDAGQVAYLKKNLGHYRLVVFMGTWCDDSHNLIPKLEKVLEQASYPMGNYAMYAMDMHKKAKNMEHKIYNITNVPTIIVYKGEMEMGRIIESVHKNIETDLVNIIREDADKDAAAAAEAVQH